MAITSIPRRPLLRYHGGKWRLAPWILSFFPPHRVYVEPYGGGGSVLLRKQRSYAEVYNDLDGEIVNLFRMARDCGAELVKAVRLTPFAREEFEESYIPTAHHLEQARRTLVRCGMGFGSSAMNATHRTGFRGSATRSGTVPATDWAAQAVNLEAVVERLRGVVIENRPAVGVMNYHDAPDTLHYLDPPYVWTTRSWRRAKDAYEHEMSDDDHREMAEAALQLSGIVVLSGYRCPLYDELFASWQRFDCDALADGAVRRVESLWLNTPAAYAILQGELSFGGQDHGRD